LHEIFREGWQWAIEQTVKFWWRSRIRVRIQIRIRISRSRHWYDLLWRRYALSQCF